MNEEEAQQLIIEELNKHIVSIPAICEVRKGLVTGSSVGQAIKEIEQGKIILCVPNNIIADRILKKIRIYIKEEEYLHRDNKIRRIVSYRILSIVSEFLMVTLITGHWEYGLITTPACLVVHTALHALVERIWR